MPEVQTRVDEGDSRKNLTAERAAIARAEAYRVKSEHARLNAAVVEAAKISHAATRAFTAYLNTCSADSSDDDPEWDRLGGEQCSAEHALGNAVDALLAFEAEHKIGDKQ